MIKRTPHHAMIIDILMRNPSVEYSADDLKALTNARNNTVVARIDDTIPKIYGVEINRRIARDEKTGSHWAVYWYDGKSKKKEKTGLPTKRNWRQSETPCPICGSWYLVDGECSRLRDGMHVKSKGLVDEPPTR